VEEKMDENLISLLKLVGSGFVTVFGFLGLGKLVELITRFFIARAEKRAEIHQANQAKQIDFDQVAFQKIIERLDFAETQLREVGEKLSSQMIDNAKLEAENVHLKEAKSRQEKEIERLREKENELDHNITGRTGIVSRLRQNFEELKKA
jgi:regulator of replication initiation timing